MGSSILHPSASVCLTPQRLEDINWGVVPMSPVAQSDCCVSEMRPAVRGSIGIRCPSACGISNRTGSCWRSRLDGRQPVALASFGEVQCDRKSRRLLRGKESSVLSMREDCWTFQTSRPAKNISTCRAPKSNTSPSTGMSGIPKSSIQMNFVPSITGTRLPDTTPDNAQ